jgi:hypothetical protein
MTGKYISIGHISKVNPHLLPIKNEDAWKEFLEAYTSKSFRTLARIDKKKRFRWTPSASSCFKKAFDAKYVESDYTEDSTVEGGFVNPIFITGNVVIHTVRDEIWVVYSGLGFGEERCRLRGYKMKMESRDLIDAIEVSIILNKEGY